MTEERKLALINIRKNLADIKAELSQIHYDENEYFEALSDDTHEYEDIEDIVDDLENIVGSLEDALTDLDEIIDILT